MGLEWQPVCASPLVYVETLFYIESICIYTFNSFTLFRIWYTALPSLLLFLLIKTNKHIVNKRIWKFRSSEWEWTPLWVQLIELRATPKKVKIQIQLKL